MAISDKTRKNLWAKSGNKCSMCKTNLFSELEGTTEFNIGEECHIISSKKTGPRHKPELNDYDTYDNLILLCRNHHKQIDELTETYTEELLRYIKLNHEKWVRTTLDSDLKSYQEDEPRFLLRITSGKELLNIVSDSLGYRTDYDESDSEEETDYIAGVIQSLIDYGELCSMVEPFDKVKMAFQLNELLNELETKGYILYGERKIENVKFGSDSNNWPIATLVLKRNSETTNINE